MHNPRIFDFKNIGLSGNRSSFDWRVYWYILKRRKWLIIVSMIIASLAGLYVALSIQRSYESSTSILIEGSRLMTRNLRQVVPGVTADDDVSKLIRYVKSSECIVGLIETLGLKKEPEIRSQAARLKAQFPDRSFEEIENSLFIDNIRKKITVTLKGRDLVQITATNKDPNMAFLMAKALADVFIQESRKRQLGGIRGVREFSEEQLAIYKNKLAKAEQKLQEFQEKILKNQMQGVDYDPATIKRLKSEITSIEINIGSKKKRLASLKSDFSSPNPLDRLKSVRLDKLRAELLSKSKELIKKLRTFNWDSPQIIRFNREINDLRSEVNDIYVAQLNASLGRGSNNHAQTMVDLKMTELDIEILERQKRELRNLVAELERNISSNQPNYEVTLRNLQQEVDQNRQVYLSFLRQSRGTQIEEEVQRKDEKFRLQIIEPAKKPLYPKGLGKKLILLISGFLGFCIGIGIVLGLEYIDQSIKSVEEVEETLHIPVWGVIPNLDDFNTSVWKREGMIYVILFFATTIAVILIFIFKRGHSF